MLKSILIGVDGSPHSLSAIELGIAWAKRFEALAVGMGVVDEPTIHGPRVASPVSASYQAAYAQLLTEARHHVERALENFALRCGEAQVACKLLEDEGVPWDRILTEAERYDLIVLGSQTHFRFGDEKRQCETLERVVRRSPRAVVVVPPEFSADRGGGVLIAYDGSLQSSRALQSYVLHGLSHLGPTTVVSVHSRNSVEAARIADRAVEYLRFHQVEARALPVVSSESAEATLLNKVDEIQASLLVMGAHGKSRLSEFLLGSTTCAVTHKSSVPVLLSS